jgi:hypothetical protein
MRKDRWTTQQRRERREAAAIRRHTAKIAKKIIRLRIWFAKKNYVAKLMNEAKNKTTKREQLIDAL